MDLQTRKAAGWSALCRLMRVGHCLSKRVLISPCIIYPQPWRYPKTIWTWSWAAGCKWPWLRRKVGTNDIWRSFPTSALIAFLWTSNCISHLSYSGLTALLKGRILPQKIQILLTNFSLSNVSMDPPPDQFRVNRSQWMYSVREPICSVW